MKSQNNLFKHELFKLLFKKLGIIIINIIITSWIFILLFTANDSLTIEWSLSYNDLPKTLSINADKLYTIFNIAKEVSVYLFTFLKLIFNIGINIIIIFIIIYKNYKIILLFLFSLWFTTVFTRNFWAKHTLKSNGDLVSKLFILFESKNCIYILLSITITILIIYISRIISRVSVWFLLGEVIDCLNTLSVTLIILLSLPLLWYMVNIIQKLLGLGKRVNSSQNSRQKLTCADFKLCNPYVVEKTNLYTVSLNFIVNYLTFCNSYLWSMAMCAVIAICYIMIKHRETLFIFYINKSPANSSVLLASPVIWEGLLSIGAVLSTGLEETDWSTININRKIRYINHQEEIINDTMNAYSHDKDKMKPSQRFYEYGDDKDLSKLRHHTNTLLTKHGDYLAYSRFSYNTSFDTNKFQGFSLNSYVKTEPNVLIMFMRSYDDNNIKYVPSFFHDPELKTVNKDLREKYGISTYKPERFNYLIIFTQEQKFGDSSFIKVWRPLPYSHMPFKDIYKNNYFHTNININRPEVECLNPKIEKIKALGSIPIWKNMEDSIIKYDLRDLIYFNILLTKKNGYFDKNSFEGIDQNGKKDCYIIMDNSKWPDPKPESYNNDSLPLYKKSLFNRFNFNADKNDTIFVANIDKLDFEAFEVTNEETGPKVYSIIDKDNLIKWQLTVKGESKTLVSYKDYNNILNDKDNSSILRMLSDRFKENPFQQSSS